MLYTYIPPPALRDRGGLRRFQPFKRLEARTDVKPTFDKCLFSTGYERNIADYYNSAEIDDLFLCLVVVWLVCQGLHRVEVFARVVNANLLFFNV